MVMTKGGQYNEMPKAGTDYNSPSPRDSKIAQTPYTAPTGGSAKYGIHDPATGDAGVGMSVADNFPTATDGPSQTFDGIMDTDYGASNP
jgi:hypothetical protein